jgi:hypothetical protein
MQQGMSETRLRELVAREHAEALEAYCATLRSIADALDRDLEPSSRQLEQAQEAKLRLENARTLLQLSAGVRADVTEISAARLRRARRVH